MFSPIYPIYFFQCVLSRAVSGIVDDKQNETAMRCMVQTLLNHSSVINIEYTFPALVSNEHFESS